MEVGGREGTRDYSAIGPGDWEYQGVQTGKRMLEGNPQWGLGN